MTLDEIKRLGLPARIITGLRLDKIAAVDLPCQEGAQATIMKRRSSETVYDFRAGQVAKHAPEPDDHTEMPQALAKLQEKGLDLSRLKASRREAIVRSYNAGRRVTVMFEKTGETFVLKRGEPVWKFDIAGHSEVEKGKGDLYEDLKPENRTAQDERDSEQQEDEMSFMEKVEEVAAARGLSKTQAMEVVRKNYPDLYTAFQNSTPTAKRAPERITKSAAQVRFEDKCAEVAKARGLPMTQAMSFCRTRYPDLFQAAYG